MNKEYPVAIVEDDPDDRMNFISSLKEVGCCTRPLLEFENGLRLLEYMKKAPEVELPSVIFLDLNMPVIDGREILKELKTNKQLKHIPIIVLTSTKSELERSFSYQMGANCHMTKPDTYAQALEFARAVTLLWGLNDPLPNQQQTNLSIQNKEQSLDT